MRRVRLLLRIGSPTCLLHAGSPWLVPSSRSLPLTTSEEVVAEAEAIFQGFPADTYPHLSELTTHHMLRPGYAYADEFLFGLDLILDGLERARDTA